MKPNAFSYNARLSKLTDEQHDGAKHQKRRSDAHFPPQKLDQPPGDKDGRHPQHR